MSAAPDGLLDAGLMAAAVALIAAGAVGALWRPGLAYRRLYAEALPGYGAIPAMIIAGAGGQTRIETAAAGGAGDGAAAETGLSFEPHRQLGLTREAYGNGLLVNALIAGGAVAALSWPTLGPVAALVVGSVVVLVAYGLLGWILADGLRQAHVQQARQFPFFLDIFLLTVQSGGGLGDAIELYLKVYGRDALGRELNILAETYRSAGEEESFRRLSERVGDEELRRVLGELSQKLRAGVELSQTLAAQRDDMRALREEQAAKIAEALNAKFMICVVLMAAAVFLIILSLPISTLVGSNAVF